MRANCATDRAEALPTHVVAKWLGRSPLVAAKRYLQRQDAYLAVARLLGVSTVTLHRWRAEYGAVDRDEVRRMNELEKGERQVEAVGGGERAGHPDLK